MANLLEPGHICELVKDSPGFALIRVADRIRVEIPRALYGSTVQLTNIPQCVREQQQIDSNVLKAMIIKEGEDHPRLEVSKTRRPLLEVFAHPGVLFVLL
jgi:hypothetical protein